MTRNDKIDGSGCLLILTLAIFLMVGTIVGGGWFFSMAWNNAATVMFGVPHIDITSGIWAMIGVWVMGLAFRAGIVDRTNKGK